jgi:hypothetical protein
LYYIPYHLCQCFLKLHLHLLLLWVFFPP